MLRIPIFCNCQNFTYIYSGIAIADRFCDDTTYMYILGCALSALSATLCLSNVEYWKVMECNKVTNIGVSTFLGGWKMSECKIYDGSRYK